MVTPVLFLIYRRPEHTTKVFNAIRQARPERLLIAADGPDISRQSEGELCHATRQCVLNAIDWPCTVETRFSDRHQGCKDAVSGALEWAFEKHEELIILEDDCLPHPDFFPWCEHLLERYRHEPRIMQICGSNLAGVNPASGQSGFFSRFGPIWGWASWRRAWRLYDAEIGTWPSVRKSPQFSTRCPEPLEEDWRRSVFDAVYSGHLDTWDYQWAYARMMNDMLAVLPSVNLVQNIGFGPEATHTGAHLAGRLSRPVEDGLHFPLAMPSKIAADPAADRLCLKDIVGLPTTPLAMLRQKLRIKVQSWMAA